MAKRKQRVEEDARELTRKEVRVRARDRERNRRLYLGAGIAIGLALLVIIAGLVKTFVLDPNSTLASVDGDKIITQQFWKRTKLEQSQMENQLVRLQELEKQFGGWFIPLTNETSTCQVARRTWRPPRRAPAVRRHLPPSPPVRGGGAGELLEGTTRPDQPGGGLRRKQVCDALRYPGLHAHYNEILSEVSIPKGTI
jgi:hypothetical protein